MEKCFQKILSLTYERKEKKEGKEEDEQVKKNHTHKYITYKELVTGHYKAETGYERHTHGTEEPSSLNPTTPDAPRRVTVPEPPEP